MSAPEIVVVGAGAVGVVYGLALKQGGARLTFLVRPQYVDAVKQGIRVSGSRTGLLVADDVVSDVEALRGRAIAQVWVCLPTTGVQMPWLQALAGATGDATLVDLSADGDRRMHAAHPARVVEGSIPLIAYQSPLPGVVQEAGRAPGIALWLPPLAKTPLSGVRAQDCVDALKRGGMPAMRVADVGVGRALASSLFNTVIAHLELGGWTLAGLRARLDAAPAEALRVAARGVGARPGVLSIAAQPFVLRWVARLAPLFIPLPLEPYLKFHFTKVGAQTRNSLALLVEKARAQGEPAPHLQALHDALALLHP